MAPEIILEILADHPRNSLVLDPMVGSGSVPRAANELGLRAVGYDVDPLAVLIARVWTTPLSPVSLRRAVHNTLEQASLLDLSQVHLPWIDDDPAMLEYVRYWFASRQKADLRRLVAALPPDDTPVGRALRLVLSRIIITKDRGASRARDVSHSRPHRVFDDNSFDVLLGFERAGERLARCLDEEPPPGGSWIGIGEARRMLAIHDRSVDAVLTSPPYLNAIDYIRGHRLALVWLGYQLDRLASIRSNSIGAERAPDGPLPDLVEQIRPAVSALQQLPKRFARIMERYLADLDALLGEVRRVLKPAGTATFVVGNSTVRGTFVDNAAALTALASGRGFLCVERYERPLPARLRYLPPPEYSKRDLAQRMRTEVVLTFKRMEARYYS